MSGSEPSDNGSGGAVVEDDVAALERRLRIAEERFRGIVEISADAIISVDERQRITFFNEGAEQVFGYAAAEMIGRPLDLLIPPSARPAHHTHVAEFGAGTDRARRMGHRREIAGVRKGGEEFPAEASISRFRVGDTLTYNVVLRDISERKRAEDRQRFLAEAGVLLASSLDLDVTLHQAARVAVSTLGDACVVDLLRGGALEWSVVAHTDQAVEQRLARLRAESAPSLLGSHPAAEALRARHTIVLRDIDASTAELPDDELHGALMREVRPRSAVFVALVGRDGVLGVLSLYSRQRRYDPDDVLVVEDLARRISLSVAKARLYEAAQRAIRVRDETVAVVSHDLRNPVSAIKMIAPRVAEAVAAGNPEVAREYVTVIQQAARQADALIQDLLDISRIEAGRLRLDQAPEDMAVLLERTLEVLRPLAQERGVELRLAANPGLRRGYVDAARIEQAVGNLVGNAIKFTPAGGRVEVAVAPSGAGELEVSVRDTGPGISPEHLQHLFDRFWQGGRPSRAGAGLGLPITKGIVDAHGGRVWVESVEGEGTVVRFTVPAREAR